MNDVEQKQTINELALAMCQINGYEVKEGYDFSKTTHPRGVLMWHMAEMAYEFVEQRIIEEEDNEL